MKRLLLILALLCSPAWADITFFGAGAIVGHATADVTVTLPASMVTDDIILIHCYTRDTTNTTTITDYVEIAQVDTTAADHRWFWKRHDGSEADPVCVTNTAVNNFGRAYAFRGVVKTGNPWNALGTATSDCTEPVTVTTITTGAALSMVVLMDGYEDNNLASVITTGTDPAAYTENYDETVAGDDGSATVAYEVRATAGATGTVSADYNAAFTAGDCSGALLLSLGPHIPVGKPRKRVIEY
jgi:hypothetical protein